MTVVPEAGLLRGVVRTSIGTSGVLAARGLKGVLALGWWIGLGFILGGCSRPGIEAFHHPGPTPWTHLRVNNQPRNFQFAIVSDRTGGVRPGVFEEAVRKLNLLQPEFVMSVGDLIMGNTEDLVQIDAEWNEFMGFVARLEMPFFYLPGNHDITNPVMEQEWIKRFGRPYYHFVYQDVLFLCLDTEDPPPSRISGAQRDYAAGALANHPDVRWTMVFLHKPLWDYDEETGWLAVEKLLQGRPHTVIAGHRHNYTKFERNDQSYIVLATTGGGSKLRGRAFGEFDQVAWVTMTDHGPILANLLLDGIWDENIRTTEWVSRIKEALAGRAVAAGPLFEPGSDAAVFRGGRTELRLRNDADLPMKLLAQLHSTEQVHVKPPRVERIVPPNSVELVAVDLAVSEPVTTTNLVPITVDWRIIYEVPGDPAVTIDGQLQWVGLEPKK